MLFKDMKYERPEYEQVKKEYTAYLEQLRNASNKEQFLKDMESSYRHKFAKKPQLVEGNLQCLRAAMKEVRG